MPDLWPEEKGLAYWELDVLDRDCPYCGGVLHFYDHRYRRFHTLKGSVEMVCRLNICPDRLCPGHAKKKSSEVESMIAPPFWAIGWDVFCWIGHRRFSRHMSVTLIQSELLDNFGIKLSHDAVSQYRALPSDAGGASARPTTSTEGLIRTNRGRNDQGKVACKVRGRSQQ